MLGGTVYVAMLRFAVSLAGAILLFSLMSEPRYDRKKMIACYERSADCLCLCMVCN